VLKLSLQAELYMAKNRRRTENVRKSEWGLSLRLLVQFNLLELQAEQ